MSSPATISSSTAHLLASGFAFCYVGSLYISNHTRLSFSKDAKPVDETSAVEREKLANERWRDDVDMIKARLVVVSIATTLNCCIVGLLLWYLSGGSKSLDEVTRVTAGHLGWKLGSSILPHLVTPVLFLGPLYATYLEGDLPFQRRWSIRGTSNRFLSWSGVRTYFMGPLTEEVVFRACMLAVYHLSGTSPKRMIFLTPLTFGLAHVHHAWDTYNRHGRTQAAAIHAVTSSLFQLFYTTLFGFHTSYIFLRTGSVFPSWTAHAFCNTMGFPMITYELRRFRHRRTAIITMYIAGIIGFIYVLPRWTYTPDSMFWR